MYSTDACLQCSESVAVPKSCVSSVCLWGGSQLVLLHSTVECPTRLLRTSYRKCSLLSTTMDKYGPQLSVFVEDIGVCLEW